MKCCAIIVAAGVGKRFGCPDKVFVEINNKPLFMWSLQIFEKSEFIDDIWIVTRKNAIERTKKIIKNFEIQKVRAIIEGGKERQDSVYNALKGLYGDTDIVLIHDAARPLISKELIQRVIEAMDSEVDGVIPAIELTDTIKWIKKRNIIGGTLNRSILRAVQTPQAFWFKRLLKAYERAYEEGIYGTDDAFLVERYGGKVIVVRGDEKNIKITTKQDLEKAKLFLRYNEPDNIRIGIGYDSHRLVSGKKLIIGGVEIPYEKGLEGHSDADVLVHAIIDALLGSAGLGDIGKHFPDTDPEYKDISSILLLEKTLELLKNHNIKPLWIDCTIFAENPKMSPYISTMKENLHKIGLNINIKAKTNEGMGFVGRGEGIAAQAVCLSRVMLDS